MKISCPAKFTFNFILLKFVLILLLFTFPTKTSAELANSDEMSLVCQNWLALNIQTNGNWGGVDNPVISGIKEISQDGILMARYYEITPDGFVVVPVLMELPPVLVSSDNSIIDFDEPEGVLFLIQDVLSDRLNRFEDYFGSLEYSTRDNRSDHDFIYLDDWDNYLLNEKDFLIQYNSGEKTRAVGGPLLTTAWHQGAPYNNLCPMGDGGRTVVGCVATASAQILRFWEWPIAGEGSKAYYWDGDESCNEEGTPGENLSADFSDSYIWDDDPANLAEINYEVGVAFSMDYGRCGSGAYTDWALNVFPSYFKYKGNINIQYRSAHDVVNWYEIIRDEIEAGRPMQYRIYSHSIVCDGYRDTGGLLQYHFNYGWGGSLNAWFTIDDLYCPWSGCSPMAEFLIRNIEPERIIVSIDESFGIVPHEVNFTGETELVVDSWSWDFGDSQQSYIQSPSHTYELPGIYDVVVEINSGGKLIQLVENDFIIVVADTMIAGNIQGEVGSSVEIPIYIRNMVPLKKVVIPVSYSGGLQVSFDSISTDGCRMDEFIEQVHNIGSGFLAVELIQNITALDPGEGVIVNLYFTILSEIGSSPTILDLDDIGSYQRMFYSDIADYQPAAVNGTIQLPFLCGDTDGNKLVNILDIVYLINYKYKSGTAPDPLESADVNNDDLVNILDIVYLINYKYKDGPDPVCP